MNGVRPLSGNRLVHVLGVSEEGVPVVSGREAGFVLDAADLQDVCEAAQLDALALQLSQQAFDGAPVLHLALEADEVHGALGDAQRGELLRMHHGLQPLHHLPVGDGLAGRLEVRQSHADREFGAGFEVETELGTQIHRFGRVAHDGRHSGDASAERWTQTHSRRQSASVQ